jgi:uncharacterized membrane protein
MSFPEPAAPDSAQARTERPIAEPVWTFRGYAMRPAEFSTAMVHFYRGEIQRANTWRNRLDATTNWAILTTAAVVSFALADPSHHHGIILINLALIFMLMVIEARRYRYYELWSYRVRLLETDYFAAMLVPPFQPSPDWAETLASSLLRPQFPISAAEALGRRLRRNYLAIFGFLIAVWLFKNYTQPDAVTSWAQFVQRASVGPLSGSIVLFGLALFSVGMALFAFGTWNLQQATGEVLQQPRVFAGLRFGNAPAPKPNASSPWRRPTQRPSARREEYMAMIISDKPQEIAERVMQELNRGVTALHGEGMYTQTERDVLMCALTATEINALKNAVKAVDPSSFFVLMPAAEVAGHGFQPLAT